VVASPPYHISADLLRMLLAAGPRLAAADLVLQRAVVRKYAGHAAGASSSATPPAPAARAAPAASRTSASHAGIVITG
jgi:hypothetical protein